VHREIKKNLATAKVSKLSEMGRSRIRLAGVHDQDFRGQGTRASADGLSTPSPRHSRSFADPTENESYDFV
jgi:hypothetical protein